MLSLFLGLKIERWEEYKSLYSELLLKQNPVRISSEIWTGSIWQKEPIIIKSDKQHLAPGSITK